MSLFSHYRIAAIYPSLYILLFSAFHSFMANYESNSQTDYSAIIMSIATAFFFALLMSILSLTIFLNKSKKINSKLIWNILTWFFLPISYLAMVFVYEIKIRNKFEFGFGNDFIFLLIVTIPFVVGLFWSFIEYRRKLVKANSIRIS